MTVIDWSVRCDVKGFELSDELAGQLLEELENHGAVLAVSQTDPEFSVTLAVEADKASRAGRFASDLVRRAMNRLHIDGDIVGLHALTMDRLAAENRDREGELYVGISDIAREHEFSRQRAHELTKLEGFPEPVAATSAGRVWRFSDVENFLSKPRSPGRPRKDATVAPATVVTRTKVGTPSIKIVSGRGGKVAAAAQSGALAKRRSRVAAGSKKRAR